MFAYMLASASVCESHANVSLVVNVGKNGMLVGFRLIKKDQLSLLVAHLLGEEMGGSL